MDNLVIDVETTLNGNDTSGLAHPMHPANKIVLVGTCSDKYEYDSRSVTETVEPTLSTMFSFIVGHNVGFDLKYLYNTGVDNKKSLQKCRLWDTQLAEYLLSGQQDRWMSLDELCIKRGFDVKDSFVTDFFKRGLGAEHVPSDKLDDYLKHDVTVTGEIAKQQMKEAVDKEMLPLIISQMEALHATIEMTYNGLAINTPWLTNYYAAVTADQKAFEDNFALILPQVDPHSSKSVSTYLFGGSEKIKVKEPVGVYKNGKTKYKTVEKLKPIEGVYSGEILAEWVNKSGYSVNDEVLSAIANKITTSVLVRRMCLDVLKIRELSKIRTTYCEGIMGQLLRDCYVYGNINHTATVTGRLSSSNPNLQNISNSVVKKCFVSRFEKGRLVEFDFSQLEIVALAELSQDKQLLEDLFLGKDIHSELYMSMYGRYPTDAERKPFKRLSFGLVYGAGYKTLAKNAGVSDAIAKQFISVFYTRYPGVKSLHDKMIAEADKNGVAGLDMSRKWEYILPTGRRFVFKEYENDDWRQKKTGRKYGFSPTELKNYPVQGLATGDIVPLMLGVLFRKFVDRKGIVLCNTVHDSVLFDINLVEVNLDMFVTEVLDVLNNTHKYFESTFKYPLSVKLNAGCKVGINWYEMSDYEVDNKE